MCSRCLTCEPSGRRWHAARPGLQKMYTVPVAWAWWHAVGAPRERLVMPHCALRLEPEVANTSSVPRQVLPFLQSIEVIDRKVGYGFRLCQAQIYGYAAAAFFVRLQ